MGAAEKVKDLKNLAAELNLDLNANASMGKLFSAALDLLEDMASELDALRADRDKLDKLSERVYLLEANLEDLEDALFEEAEADDETSYAIRCPNCGGRVEFDESALDGDIICPDCGEILRFDTPEDVVIDDSDE